MLPSSPFHSMRLIFYRFLLRSFCRDGFVSRWDHRILPPRNPVKEVSAAPVLCLDFFRFPRTGSTKTCLEA